MSEMTMEEKAQKIAGGSCDGISCIGCPVEQYPCYGTGKEKEQRAREWLSAHQPQTLSDLEKLEKIAGGSCEGWCCSECPMESFHDLPQIRQRCWEYLEGRARAREMLGIKTGVESTIGAPHLNIPTPKYLGRVLSMSIGGITIPTFDSVFSTPFKRESLVEKRRATRRRLLGF